MYVSIYVYKCVKGKIGTPFRDASRARPSKQAVSRDSRGQREGSILNLTRAPSSMTRVLDRSNLE